MKCKNCYKEERQYRRTSDFADCILLFDWQSFRAEAAKDILCAMIQGGYAESRIEHQSKLAVKYADTLISKLKEKERE